MTNYVLVIKIENESENENETKAQTLTYKNYDNYPRRCYGSDVEFPPLPVRS